MDTLLTVLTITNKIVSVIDSGMEVGKVCLDEDRTTSDIVNACANGVFGVLQIGDICVRHTPLSKKVSSSLQKGTATVTAGLDSIRFVTKNVVKFNKTKWTWVDIVFTSLEGISLCTNRLGDLANVYQIDSSCSSFNDTCQKIEKYAVIVGTIANLGATSIRLYYSVPALISAAKKCKHRRLLNRGFKQTNSQKKPSSSQVIEQNRENSLSSRQENSIFEQTEGEIEANEIMEFLGDYEKSVLNNSRKEFLSQLKKVPDFINKKSWLWCCSISKQPIRFVVIPKIPFEEITEETAEILYEKETLEDWIRNNPMEKPPNWPDSYWPLNPPIFIDDLRTQIAIDRDILYSIENLQKDYVIARDHFSEEEKGISIEEQIDQNNF